MSKWIRFDDAGLSPSRKTRRWIVYPTDGSNAIGGVKWYTSWRKYCFFSFEGTVFEEQCLRDIAEFIEARTREHKNANRRTD